MGQKGDPTTTARRWEPLPRVRWLALFVWIRNDLFPPSHQPRASCCFVIRNPPPGLQAPPSPRPLQAILLFPDTFSRPPTPRRRSSPSKVLSFGGDCGRWVSCGGFGMGSNSVEDYSWIDDVGGGGSEGELRWALDGFCDLPSAPGVATEEPYGNVGGPEGIGSRKRARNESSLEPKSKACREKIRRDRLNDRFIELSSVLDPERHPKSDKASILSDAARALVQLRSEAQQRKEENEKLQDTIKDLKAEKNELRDEKMKLKADKERLEQQIKAMGLPPTGFLPHPASLHAATASATFTSQTQAPAKTASFPQHPGVAMWHWLPPTLLDTSQDSKLWPPNA